MTREETLEGLIELKIDTLKKICVIHDYQETIASWHPLQLVKVDVLLSVNDTFTVLLMDLVTLLVTIEGRINTITAHRNTGVEL